MDVKTVVRHCVACDQVKGSFTAQPGELNPLQISGLFYCWGIHFCGPFETTIRGHKYVIDHGQISASHPQANGLAEGALQICKNALRCINTNSGGCKDWDQHLPYVLLGCSCSEQASTKVSPYTIMEPTIPLVIKPRSLKPLDLATPRQQQYRYYSEAWHYGVTSKRQEEIY